MVSFDSLSFINDQALHLILDEKRGVLRVFSSFKGQMEKERVCRHIICISVSLAPAPGQDVVWIESFKTPLQSALIGESSATEEHNIH